MKLTDDQWEDISGKLTSGMSKDDIKKILSDLSYDYDDEDIRDILVGVGPDNDNVNTDHLEWPKDPHDLSFYLTDEEKDKLEELFDKYDDEYSHSVMEENDEDYPDEGDMNSRGAYYLNGDWVSPRTFFNHMKSLDDTNTGSDSDKTPDDPDESSDKPHDIELAGEKTPEEDFMQRAVAGKIPATSNVLAGDLTPEEIEMIQMMRAGKKPQKSNGLAGETTPEEKEMFNITNRLAKNLSKHRW